MKIQNVFKQSQAKHGQHSRIMASGLVSGVGRLMMGDALWLFKCVCVCVCVLGFSLCICQSPISQQLWLLISLVLKAPQVFFLRTDLDLIAHSSGDKLLIRHLTRYL